MQQYITQYDSPLGPLTLISDGENLTGIWMREQKHPVPLPENAVETDSLPVLLLAVEWLDRYFRGEAPELSLPLAPRGSDFRQTVWKLLCDIPYGELTTYGELARRIADRTGKAMSAQAVGGAVGHNPISIIIPCHRVVGADGSLTGYGGGMKRKIHLLQLEKVDMSKLYVPVRGTAL